MQFYYIINLLFLIVNVQSFWTTFEWLGVENSKTGLLISNVKVTRCNRTTFSLSGLANITADLNDDYDAEMKVFFSSKGNNQYVMMPYKIPRDSVCKQLETQYWKSVEKRLLESSDIPKRNGTQRFCFSIHKGAYTVRQFAFDQTVIPKFLESGTYKGEVYIYKKNSNDASSVLIYSAKLY